MFTDVWSPGHVTRKYGFGRKKMLVLGYCLILALILALTYSSRLYNSHTMNFHAHIYVIGETMFYELKTRGEAQRNVS